MDPIDDGRYQTLLKASSAIAAQTSTQAVLLSLRELLSTVVTFDSVSLFLLSENQESVRLVAFDRGPEAPVLEIGTQMALAGTPLGQTIDEQRPIYSADAQSVIRSVPGLGARRSTGALEHLYAFPISTSRKKLGALVFGTANGVEFTDSDVELMSSISTHVALTLESAAANDAAASYQRKLAQERDRLRLLLEINNHIVSRLNVDELFVSASTSLRKYFADDFCAFWLLNKESGNMECRFLDFPGSQTFQRKVAVSDLSDQGLHNMHARKSEILSREEIDRLPPALSESLKAESITSLAISPLLTSKELIGALTLGARRPNSFSQDDLDMLSQIGGQISLALDNAIAYGRLNAFKNRLEDERLYLEEEIRSEYNFEDIVGNSPALRRVLDQVAIVAPTGSTVLLHGETGTGKELVARAIHSLSPRKDRTFVRLNCAAIPSGLVESELFGHEKGAFTGALMQKRGRFELADKGSLFLDEIGDISLELQPKLLRALQEREFERLGSARTIRVDVRLIAATHRDLPGMIRAGQFREDLFYRLNVFPIEIPPLRDRREDIPLLVHFFVSRLSRQMRKDIRSIPKAAMEVLTNAPWPGNVRELENFIERAVILSQGDELVVPSVEIRKAVAQGSAPASTFEEAERKAIIDALKAAAGKISGKGGAAERLGLKRTTLQNKMERLGITKSDYLSPLPE